MIKVDSRAAGDSLGGERVEGASFSSVMKALATLLMLGLAFAAGQVLLQGAWAQWDPGARFFIAVAMVVLLAGYWGILSSRTSVDGRSIRQSWLWRKEVALADITQLKLIHVRGLSWLVAPRLVVRSGSLGLTTFHVADPQVLEAFRRLAYG